MRLKTIVLAAAAALGFTGWGAIQLPYRLSFNTLDNSTTLPANEGSDASVAPVKWRDSGNFTRSDDAKSAPYSLSGANSTMGFVKNDATGLANAAEGYCLAVWIKPESNNKAAWTSFLAFRIGTGNFGLEWMDNSGKCTIFGGIGGSATGPNNGTPFNLSMGAWHHLALVIPPGSTEESILYVDGVEAVRPNFNFSENVFGAGILTQFALGPRREGTASDGAFRASYSGNVLADELAIYTGEVTAADVAVMARSNVAAVPEVKATTVSADATWSQVIAAAGITTDVLPWTALTITTEGNPTITVDTPNAEINTLTVNGAVTFAAADALYTDGCFSIDLLKGNLSVPEATAVIKEGYKGKSVIGDSAIILYAQNREVISVNIGGGNGSSGASPDKNLVLGEDYQGLYPVPGESWNNISGQWDSKKTVTLTSAKAYDGAEVTVRNSMRLSGTAKNTWRCDSLTNPFLRGYLDDGGDGVNVTVTGIPYTKYDVIVYLTSDDTRNKLRPLQINGTWWTFDADKNLVESTGANGWDGTEWGAGQVNVPEIGKNAIRIIDVTGETLTVFGYRPTSGNNGVGGRATVAAVQVINKGELASMDWTASLTATTTWGNGEGAGLANTSGEWANGVRNTITITNTVENATLTLDGEVTAAVLKIVSPQGKKLHLAKAEGATLDIAAYDLTEAIEEVVFDFDPDFTKVDVGENWWGVGYDVNGRPQNNHHYQGSANAWTFESNFSGGRYWLDGAGTLTGDIDLFGGAAMTISGTYKGAGETSMLGATSGTLTIAEGADVTVDHIKLQNDQYSNTAVMNVNGAVRITSPALDANVYDVRFTKGVLFGHWSGSTTVTIGSKGSLDAHNSWVQMTFSSGTAMTVQGVFKAKGINAGKNTSTLTVTEGGTIELGDGGFLDEKNKCTCTFNSGMLKAVGPFSWVPTTTTFTGDNTVIDANGFDLSFAGTFAGEGSIAFANSSATAVSVNLTTARPQGEITLAENVTLKLTLANGAEVPVLRVSAEPAEGKIVLVDASGNEVSGTTYTYDAAAGTVTIMPGLPTWQKTEASSSFEEAANWNHMPNDGDEVLIKVDGETVIDIAGNYSFANLTVSGSGRVTFTGAGTITAAATRVVGGADLVFPAGFAYGALTVDDGCRATSEGGATIASTAGIGTFVITNGTITIGSGGNPAPVLGAYHTVIEEGGVLSIAGRDTFTCNRVDGASLEINKGGKFTTSTFVRVPKVYLRGGTVETTGGWDTTWATVCYHQGIVAEGQTPSILTNACSGTASEVTRAEHQLQSSTTIDVGPDATLIAYTGFRNGPSDNGMMKCSLVKTGLGELIVNGNSSYTGSTTVSQGRYAFNGVNATTSTDQNCTVGADAALTGSGAITGKAKVVLSAINSCLGGSLIVDNLTYAAGSNIGNLWNPAEVTVTTVLTNSNFNTAGESWLNVENGSLTLASGLELTPHIHLYIKSNGCLVAGAGDAPIAVPYVNKEGVGAMLMSEVKVVDRVKTTGSFAFNTNFDLSNWTIGVKTPEGVRPPSKTAIATLPAGNSFSNFNRKAIPADVKAAFLSIEQPEGEGPTLYYNANQNFFISIR